MTISQTNSQRLPDGLEVQPDSFGPIIRVDERRRLEAVVRLLSVGDEPDQVRAERFIAFSQKNGVRLDALWSRLDEGTGRIIHTALAVPSPGRTAMVFASRPQRQRDVPVIAGLIDHAATAVALEGVHLAQALLDPTDLLERDTFLKGGFEELARLSYLERPLPRWRRKSTIYWPDGVSVESYREELDDDLLAILDASYEDTLDCPGLRGQRETRDILAGHKATGAFEPNLWTILRMDGRPAGALLLNPSPPQRSMELVYIGLAKSARGRGLGTLLLRYGFDLLAGRPERTMTLAVDERNTPALTVYTREGFRRVLRRVALIRRTSPGRAALVAGLDSAAG